MRDIGDTRCERVAAQAPPKRPRGYGLGLIWDEAACESAEIVELTHHRRAPAPKVLVRAPEQA